MSKSESSGQFKKFYMDNVGRNVNSLCKYYPKPRNILFEFNPIRDGIIDEMRPLLLFSWPM